MHRIRLVSLVAAAAAGSLAFAPLLARGTGVPVMVGGEAELDACGSVGHVTGGALAVRTAPNGGARASDHLAAGHLVWICQQRGKQDGAPDWLGIVYDAGPGNPGKNGVPPACGVDRPLAHARAYRGPCRAGWVPAAKITFDAG